jgi:hypothetical protein
MLCLAVLSSRGEALYTRSNRTIVEHAVTTNDLVTCVTKGPEEAMGLRFDQDLLRPKDVCISMSNQTLLQVQLILTSRTSMSNHGRPIPNFFEHTQDGITSKDTSNAPSSRKSSRQGNGPLAAWVALNEQPTDFHVDMNKDSLYRQHEGFRALKIRLARCKEEDIVVSESHSIPYRLIPSLADSAPKFFPELVADSRPPRGDLDDFLAQGREGESPAP